jgi:glucan biosynthesis protein C
MPHAPPDRYHALDSLRGFAMLLGVLLHAGLSFAVLVPAFWSVRDNDPSPLADVFLFAVHDFRMQLFFLLAGFFGCLLYLKYGPAGMGWHRAKRVLVPLLLGVVFVIPPVLASLLYVEIENARSSTEVRGGPGLARPLAEQLIAANPDAGSARLAIDYVLSGGAFSRLIPAHLWFLYFLVIFYAAVLLLAPVLSRLSGTEFLARVDAVFRRVIEGRWRVLLPAVLTLPLLLTMRTWIVDTPASWAPQAHLLAYYALFFAFGWMLYRHRDLVGTFGRGWRVNLAVANLLVLPVSIGLVATGSEAEKHAEGFIGWRVGGFATAALYTWLMVCGLWGAFLHYFAAERRWVRYLADASYWCYLMSITPIVLLQFWVKDWPVPGVVKFGLVTVLTMGLLLASYEWGVRYTFVGAILNGRKYRPRAEAATKPEAVAVLK